MNSKATSDVPERQGLATASFESMQLQVGTRLQVRQQVAGAERVSYTSLIGYVPQEFLLLRLPQENGFSVPVAEGETLQLRVFSGTSVYSFACTVEVVFLTPRNYMILGFPGQVMSLTLRRDVRVPIDMPVMVNSNATAVLTDISASGAQVTAELPLAHVGERMSLGFSLRTSALREDVRVQLDAVVQSVRERPTQNPGEPALVDHGVQFPGLPSNDAMLLQNFVYESLLHKR